MRYYYLKGELFVGSVMWDGREGIAHGIGEKK
jgi:hypothetical protein